MACPRSWLAETCRFLARRAGASHPSRPLICVVITMDFRLSALHPWAFHRSDSHPSASHLERNLKRVL